MADITGIMALSTSNYDTMKRFLTDFGFQVNEDHRDPLVPLFENGRGATVRRGEIFFQLEESSRRDAKASFNLLLFDYAPEDIERIKGLGYKCEQQPSPYGTSHSFETPDGGTFVVN